MGFPEWWDSGAASELRGLLACPLGVICMLEISNVFDPDSPHNQRVGVYRGLFSVVTCACSCREAESEARHCCGKWVSPGRPHPPQKGHCVCLGKGEKRLLVIESNLARALDELENKDRPTWKLAFFLATTFFWEHADFILPFIH